MPPIYTIYATAITVLLACSGAMNYAFYKGRFQAVDYSAAADYEPLKTARAGK